MAYAIQGIPLIVKAEIMVEWEDFYSGNMRDLYLPDIILSYTHKNVFLGRMITMTWRVTYPLALPK